MRSIIVLLETESYDNRVEALKVELDKLPYDNYEMLDIITGHLKKWVFSKTSLNLNVQALWRERCWKRTCMFSE